MKHPVIASGVSSMVEFLAEVEPLLVQQWRELAADQERVPMVPDYAVYLGLWQAGACHVVTARDDGKLAGYIVFFVRCHPHYATTLMAFADSFYVLPEYRKSLLALRMVKHAIADLKRCGVQVVHCYAKPFNNLGKVLEYAGMTPTETTYRLNVEDFKDE